MGDPVNIKDLLLKLVKGAIPVSSVIATVISVDKHKCTIDANPLSGASLCLDVRLAARESNPEGIVLFPKVGSTVIISMIDNNRSNMFVSMYSEIEDVQFHDGINGGLVKVKELVGRLNRLESRITSHQHLYLSPAGSAIPTTADPASNATMPPTSVSELENIRIKH
jgi:hypothetical protein